MDREFIKNWAESLKEIINLHQQIKHIDLSLEKLHAVAIVKHDTFYVFDYNRTKKVYELVYEKHMPGLQIPDKVLASFPLDFYNMKAAAVISEDALTSLEKQIFVFHEFVHCYQYENGETELKEALGIYKKYKKENNPMWEIKHPFPYDNADFSRRINSLAGAYNAPDEKKILGIYGELKNTLSDFDYEYMIWQEFKEGYARYVENNIRQFLKIQPNDSYPKAPFTRALFYWMGSRHISFIKNIRHESFNSLAELFSLMINK